MAGPPPLRIAVLGDLDSVHVRRWLAAMARRGHELHAVSFYPPAEEVPTGVTVHVLRDGRSAPAPDPAPAGGGLRGRLPPSLLRPLHGARYLRSGLKETLRRIQPDVLHAHYVVEHGFYAALSGFRPLVVSAWGSDVYRALLNPLSNAIARWTVRRASLVTASDPAMLRAVRRLGAREDDSMLLRIGALEALFFEVSPQSANAGGGDAATVISARALEPLYNIGTIIDAFARVHAHLPAARLQVAHDGSERRALEARVAGLGIEDSVSFLGRLTPLQLRDALSGAAVYVSVPDSDSMAASTMEAMARGCFPIVSDLPSQDGFIEHGVTGLRVSAGDVETLAAAMQRALVDDGLRRAAVEPNRKRVEAEGRLEAQAAALEARLLQMVGRG